MAHAGIEPCEMDFDKIITCFDMLEEIDPEHKDSEVNQTGKRAHIKNNKG